MIPRRTRNSVPSIAYLVTYELLRAHFCTHFCSKFLIFNCNFPLFDFPAPFWENDRTIRRPLMIPFHHAASLKLCFTFLLLKVGDDKYKIIRKTVRNVDKNVRSQRKVVLYWCMKCDVLRCRLRCSVSRGSRPVLIIWRIICWHLTPCNISYTCSNES